MFSKNTLNYALGLYKPATTKNLIQCTFQNEVKMIRVQTVQTDSLHEELSKVEWVGWPCLSSTSTHNYIISTLIHTTNLNVTQDDEPFTDIRDLTVIKQMDILKKCSDNDISISVLTYLIRVHEYMCGIWGRAGGRSM